jgi:hypothetical protein
MGESRFNINVTNLKNPKRSRLNNLSYFFKPEHSLSLKWPKPLIFLTKTRPTIVFLSLQVLLNPHLWLQSWGKYWFTQRVIATFKGLPHDTSPYHSWLKSWGNGGFTRKSRLLRVYPTILLLILLLLL